MMDELHTSHSGVLSGLLEFLESKPGVRDIELVRGKPIPSAQIISWEKTNRCGLPDDLKNFYLTNNGLTLTWNYLYQDIVHPLGRLNINPLTSLLPLGGQSQPILFSQNGSVTSARQPLLGDLDIQQDTVGEWRPSLSGCCKIFTLDYCSSCGHTCLVYNMEEGNDSTVVRGVVWLLDLSLTWHPLCSSFSDYLRLAVVHLGLTQWPYTLTSNGLSPLYERWSHMFVPRRLDVDLSLTEQPNNTSSSTPTQLNQTVLDVSKIAVTKSNKDKKSKSDVSTSKPAGGTKKTITNR